MSASGRSQGGSESGSERSTAVGWGDSRHGLPRVTKSPGLADPGDNVAAVEDAGSEYRIEAPQNRQAASSECHA